MADKSPVHQFVIQDIFKIDFNGIDLSFTNSAAWMVAGVVFSTLFLSIAMRKKQMVPGRMQMFAEIVYEFIAKMVRENIGAKGRIFFPFVFTIFIFVLMGNLLGLLPWAFTYTSHIAVTGALALMVFLSVIVVGLAKHGLKFFSLFVPSGTPIFILPLILPIEVISFFIRPLTLSVRLFANIMAGHMLLKIIAGFAVTFTGIATWGFLAGALPTLLSTIMLMFELLVAVVQAYVFAILSCIYLKDAVDLHH